ncbi:MAG: serine/threonine-protein kinase [Gemmataceae bacterium]
MAFTVQNIYGLLIRSKLLPLEECKTLFDRWQKEGGQAATSTDAFTRWMVVQRYVTDYQAGLLARGHAEGFFIDQYKILDRIGRGRMAGVYKAVHSLGQVVAIKVLPPSKAKDPQLLARFQREARLAMKMKHPNVVRAFQVGYANNLHYIVMEYLEGETLDDVLQRRKKLPAPEAVRIIYQTLLGLQHLYEQNLVHRDLKPSNLMLTPAPTPGQPDTTTGATVKILDIGLGRSFFDENSPVIPDPQLTGEGVLLGTPDYLAPEQARDARSVDIRADIYSLGCVLYHALTGKPPFPDTNIINQMVRHATETPRPVRDFSPEVPDGLQQILNWMMAKDPAQRYPTPERAAQALQVFLAAGADAARNPAEPQLNSYLNWLEKNNPNASGRKGDQPSKSASRGPATMKIKGPSPVPRHLAAAAKRQRAKRKSKSPPVAKPAVPPPAKPIPAAAPATAKMTPALPAGLDIDVELVPAGVSSPPPPPPTPPSVNRLGLSRRDLLLLGIGGGAVLFACGLGALIHFLSNRNK